ncbi:MAG TPA: GGDEF domain-containing protein [Pseudonocardiaceae bacterium]
MVALRWVRGWDLWSESRRFVCYVLGTELVVVVAMIVITLHHPSLPLVDWMRFAMLAGCAVVHVELVRDVERVRNRDDTGPRLRAEGMWSITAVIVLPPVMAAGMVIVTRGWAWLRVVRGHRPPNRWIFSASTVMLANLAAVAILAGGPGAHPGPPTTLMGFGVVVVALGARWLINYVMVAVSTVVSRPDIPVGELLRVSDGRLEFGTYGLGFVAAGLVYNPLLLIGVVLGVVALHRAVLLPQFQAAASIDAKTGLHTVTWWRQIAERTMSRHESVALLMLDLDHFKKVNDTYGHMAGDHVLRAVADAVRAEIRGQDIAGRWGGEEFVVLVPNVDTDELRAVAERVRRRVRSLVIAIPATNGPVRNPTISIGGALSTDTHPAQLDELLIAADAALYQAKDLGRDRVEVAGHSRSLR